MMQAHKIYSHPTFYSFIQHSHTRSGSRPQILKTIYDHLVIFNLERYTINRQRTELRAIIAEIRKEYQNWKPETKKTKTNQDKNKN
jgi:hypothetical protein